MTNLRGWRRLFLVGLVFLLVVTLPACACTDFFEQLINELIVELERALVERWNNFIADLQQQITDWWNNLVEDTKQGLADWWEDRKQDWNDFWGGVFPSPPTITSPADGSRLDRLVIPAEGQGRAGNILVVYRDEQEIAELAIGSNGFWHLDELRLHPGENLITAQMRGTLLPLIKSAASNTVRVVSTVDTPHAKTPAITPNLPPDLNRFEWMTALALYADHHNTYFNALRLGLLASQTDEIAHHYLDPELNLSNDVVYLVFSARAENTLEEVLAALLEAAAVAVADDVILAELQTYIRESLTVVGQEVVQVGGEEISLTTYSIRVYSQ